MAAKLAIAIGIIILGMVYVLHNWSNPDAESLGVHFEVLISERRSTAERVNL
jgi:hypothetical protein